MADESKLGTDWGDDELDAIVADYFAMLDAELAGRAYVKAHHSKALMERIGRTHRSVEFKHMNISAVLAELGLPTIKGYKPKANYQGAIFDAIDRYLSAHRALLTPAPPVIIGAAEAHAIWEEAPPALDFSKPPRPERLERLVRKFDPVERDFRNRALGEAGEKRIFDMECTRLITAERADLARKVRWVSKEDGDGAGYDIRSYDPSGAERLIEVKTTNGASTTPFFLTRNEKSLADERPDAFRLYASTSLRERRVCSRWLRRWSRRWCWTWRRGGLGLGNAAQLTGSTARSSVSTRIALFLLVEELAFAAGVAP